MKLQYKTYGGDLHSLIRTTKMIHYTCYLLSWSIYLWFRTEVGVMIFLRIYISICEKYKSLLKHLFLKIKFLFSRTGMYGFLYLILTRNKCNSVAGLGAKKNWSPAKIKAGMPSFQLCYFFGHLIIGYSEPIVIKQFHSKEGAWEGDDKVLSCCSLNMLFPPIPRFVHRVHTKPPVFSVHRAPALLSRHKKFCNLSPYL